MGQNCSRPGLALGAGAVGVDQAADGGEVAGLEFGDGGADLGDAADDFVAGDAGVDGGHDAAPLVAGLVEVGVADAAEEDLDLDVVAGWDRGGRWWKRLNGEVALETE